MTRGRTLALVLALSLAVAAGARWYVTDESTELGAVSSHWSRFSQCLVGAPLSPGETLGERLRGVRRALYRSLPPPNMRNDAVWPRTCAQPADELHTALGRLKRARTPAHAELEKKLYALVVALGDRAELVDIEGVFEAAARAGLRAVALGDAPSAPASPRAALDAVQWLPVRFPPQSPLPLETSAFGLWTETGGTKADARLCSDPFAVMPLTCPRVEVEPSSLRVVPSTVPGETWYYDQLATDRSGSVALRSLAGGTKHHRVPRGFISHALRVEDKAVFAVDANPQTRELVLSVDGDDGRSESVRIPPSSDREIIANGGPFVMADQLVWSAHGELGWLVLARKITRSPLGLEEPAPVLTASGAVPCVSRDTLALAGLQMNRSAVSGVALFDGERWHSNEVEGIGTPSSMRCQGGGVTILSVDRRTHLQQIRCNLQGCEAKDVDLDIGESLGRVEAAALGDNTLVVWQSAVGDVRMRLAPLAALDATPDRVLFDEGPAESSSGGDGSISLASRGEKALVVVRRKNRDATLVLVDANGEAKAIHVERP